MEDHFPVKVWNSVLMHEVSFHPWRVGSVGSDLQPQFLCRVRAQVQQEELLAQVVLQLLQVPGLGDAQGLLLPAAAEDGGLRCHWHPWILALLVWGRKLH